jgi:hypothetical protein
VLVLVGVFVGVRVAVTVGEFVGVPVKVKVQVLPPEIQDVLVAVWVGVLVGPDELGDVDVDPPQPTRIDAIEKTKITIN